MSGITWDFYITLNWEMVIDKMDAEGQLNAV